MSNYSEDNKNSMRKEILMKILKTLISKNNTYSDIKSKNDVYYKVKKIYIDNKDLMEFKQYDIAILSNIVELKRFNNIDTIEKRLNDLCIFSTKKNDNEFANWLKKLYEHIELECNRMNYYFELERIGFDPDRICNSINAVGERVLTQEKRVNKLIKDTDNAYSSFISILGIFSAIVMAFFGGINVFSNVIGQVNEVSMNRLIVICTLCGLIVFNLIFMFIYFLAKLLDKDISATKEYVCYQNLVTRFRYRYPIVFYTDFFCTLLFLISLAVFCIKRILMLNIKNTTVFEIFSLKLSSFFILHRLFCVSIFSMILFNILFIIAYIISKIMDVNIGCTIKLRYKGAYWWDFDNGRYIVYKESNKIKEYYDEKKANRVVAYKNFIYNLSVPFYNFCKRAFVRYPYWSIINIALFIVTVMNI